MNSSVIPRLPGIAVAKENGKASRTLASSPVVEPELSDETLMAQICEGSREALATLFRRYARMVRGVAYRVLRDTSEADDLLQDIFMVVHGKCTSFDPSRGPARFWILQMSYHRAIARRRYLQPGRLFARDRSASNREVQHSH